MGFICSQWVKLVRPKAKMIPLKSGIHTFISLFLILFLTVVTSAQTVPQIPPTEETLFVPGELIVKFKSGDTNIAVQRSLRSIGLKPLSVSTFGQWIRAQVTPGYEHEMIDNLMARGDVEFAIPNYYLYATEVPNDTNFDRQWNMTADDKGGIDAVGAWDYQTGDDKVIIAFLDGGVDGRHPEFAGKIIDSVDYVNNNLPPEQDKGVNHATHVAGIATAIGDNGQGVAGVSWGAKIISVKILNEKNLTTADKVVNGIDYAINAGANIINMSFSYAVRPDGSCGADAIIRPAIEKAYDNGILLIVAAGNRGRDKVDCPARYNEVMAVGMVKQDGTLQEKSNYGPKLDLVAPGYQIYSTAVASNGNARYRTTSGTSQSVPHVSGLAALLWSMAPTLTRAEVREIIEQTADDFGDSGRDNQFGWGRINARKAIESLTFKVEPAQPTVLLDKQSGSNPTSSQLTIQPTGTQSVSWSATISPPVPWLNITSATSGTMSATAPATVTFTTTPPKTYGTYTTTLTIKSGSKAVRRTEIRMRYIEETKKAYLPLLLN